MVKTEDPSESLPPTTPTKPLNQKPRIRKPAILQRKRKQPAPVLPKTPPDDKHRPIRPKPIQGIVVGGPIRIKKPVASPGPKPQAGAPASNGMKIGSSLQVDQLGKCYLICYVIILRNGNQIIIL